MSDAKEEYLCQLCGTSQRASDDSLVTAFVQGANFAWPHGSQTAEEEALKRLANGTLGKKGTE